MTGKKKLIPVYVALFLVLLYVIQTATVMAASVIQRPSETPASPPKISVAVPKLETFASGRGGTVSMVFTNAGGESDRLVGCSLKGSVAKCTLQSAVMKPGEQMQTAPVETVEIGPGKTVVLRRNAFHIAMFDLPENLPGTATLILKFEKSPTMEVEATVQQMKAGGSKSMSGIPPELHHGRCHE